MLTAALFTTAKTWKQPSCPSTDEWIEIMRYKYTTECHSAVRENELMPSAATWRDLELIILIEVYKRQVSHDTTYRWNLKNNTNEFIYKTETDSQISQSKIWLLKGKGRGKIN